MFSEIIMVNFCLLVFKVGREIPLEKIIELVPIMSTLQARLNPFQIIDTE